METITDKQECKKMMYKHLAQLSVYLYQTKGIPREVFNQMLDDMSPEDVSHLIFAWISGKINKKHKVNFNGTKHE